jgi:chemotaxis regulatin CheY-phosphate phosphatase CheZ
MSETQSLRRTSDALLSSLSELEELEQKKRSLPAGSKAQLRVSRQVETLARKVLREAGTQTELVESIAESEEAQSATAPREPHLILAEWRAAERTLEAEEPGTPAWENARAEVDQLRTEYGRAFRRKDER